MTKVVEVTKVGATGDSASVAQCMLVMQMTICVVLRMAGGEDVKEELGLHHISLNKGSNTATILHCE